MDYQCFYVGGNHWDGVPSVFVCIFLICIHAAFTVGGFHIVSPAYVVEEEKKSHRNRYEEESYFTLPLYKQVYLIGTKKYIAARYYIYSIIEFIANFSALLTFILFIITAHHLFLDLYQYLFPTSMIVNGVFSIRSEYFRVMKVRFNKKYYLINKKITLKKEYHSIHKKDDD